MKSKLHYSYVGIEQHLVFGWLTIGETTLSQYHWRHILGDGFVRGYGAFTLAIANSSSLKPFRTLCLLYRLNVRSLTPEKLIQKAGKLNETG